MRKNITLFFMFLVFVVTGFANGDGKKDSKKPVVTVSILPQKFFIEQIAGDFLQVNVILPPGSSPEDFEPTSKQMTELSNSSYYFYIGHLGFEKTWIKKVTAIAPKVKYISCSKGLDLLEDECTHGENHAKNKQVHGTDPHIWTSPENVKTMSRTICAELVKSYPSQKVVFEKNLNAFISKIDTLDNHIRFMFNDSISKAFMIFHPAMAYFARDYHIEQYGIEFEGKSPSTAHMKKMVDIARAKKIKTIFIQSQFETAKAQSIAREIGGNVEAIDPLAENWLGEMYSIAVKMKKAMHIVTNE